MNFWLVAQTKTKRECVAKTNIERVGFETYLPRVRFRRGRKIKVEPLFSGYLFVRLSQESWSAITSAVGVTRLIRNGEQPAKLDAKVIAELRAREKGGYVQMPTTQQVKPGQRVRILRGAFQGRIAINQEMSSTERQRVLLDWLGRKVSVELDRTDIEPLATAP